MMAPCLSDEGTISVRCVRMLHPAQEQNGQFRCVSCGFAVPADIIAAGNIARPATAQ